MTVYAECSAVLSWLLREPEGKAVRIVLASADLVIASDLAPLPLAVAHGFDVLGIDPDLVPVIVGAAAALALRLAVNALLRTVDGRLKGVLAVATAARPARPFLIALAVLVG